MAPFLPPRSTLRSWCNLKTAVIVWGNVFFFCLGTQLSMVRSYHEQVDSSLFMSHPPPAVRRSLAAERETEQQQQQQQQQQHHNSPVDLPFSPRRSINSFRLF
jgi:hypothetical protein